LSAAEIPVYCPHCESPKAVVTDLSYIGHDGSLGTIAGILCRACSYIAELKDAAPVPSGRRIDIPKGMTAMEWFVARLRALGCKPRPRP
jgi:hypothetical protein